jgi:pimeloyl-ACP methyl ester carboxylesterase
VNIDDLEIFYRQARPKDAPAVLLLRGFPTSSQMFRNLIPALADKIICGINRIAAWTP